MRNKDTKVFIPNKGGHNFSDAERFGEVIYVTTGIVNRLEVSSIYRAFVDVMKDSGPEDYFVPTSMSILNAVGAAVFARMHGKLNLLVYKDRKYVPRELDIDALLDFLQEEENT